MRHRRKGRKLGRCPSHQRALLRNLAAALFLTERDAEEDENKPKVKGRIITTLEKAKEVRPVVERAITIARRAIAASSDAEQFATTSRTPDRRVAQMARKRSVAKVGPSRRAVGGWSPSGPGACSATSKPCASCSTRWRRASPSGPGATPACCD